MVQGLAVLTWSAQAWADPMLPQYQVGIQGPPGTAGSNGTNGLNGTNGAAGTMAVGTVSTLPANSSATVVNVGNSTSAILNFGIPQGVIGATGATGTPGLAGTQFTSAQLTTNTAGAVTWTYPALCNSSSKFWAQPIASATGTLVNVQNIGMPNSSTQVFQVNVTNFSTVALLGLTILSVPASPGTTTVNVFCQP
jgi:hypothetical protein